VKKLASFIFSAIGFLSFAPYSFAAKESLCSEKGQFKALCDPQIGDIIVGLINLIFILSVIVALLYLIWGGFKWLTSGGDKTAVQGAREHIVAAIVGLVVIFMSYFILNFIVGFFLPGFSLRNFTIPSVTNPSGKYTGGHVTCRPPQKESCTVVGGTLVCYCKK